MADQEKDKQMQIDEMLDSMLANYSAVEPRPGLETRILANLRETPKKQTAQGWWNFKWVWAGMVAAAIIVAAVLISGRRHVTPPTNVVVKTNQPAPQPEIQPHAPAARQETARVHRRKPPVPTLPQDATLALSERPAIFPTPTPLSEQEKLLLSYVAGTPREEVIAQSHPDEPPVVGDQDQTEAIPDLMHIPQKISNTR
jgi:hypothetical protein